MKQEFDIREMIDVEKEETVYWTRAYSKLNYNEDNRTVPVNKKLEASIKKMGILEPLLCTIQDGQLTLVEGHTRLTIAKKLLVPVPFIVREDLTFRSTLSAKETAKPWKIADIVTYLQKQNYTHLDYIVAKKKSTQLDLDALFNIYFHGSTMRVQDHATKSRGHHTMKAFLNTQLDVDNFDSLLRYKSFGDNICDKVSTIIPHLHSKLTTSIAKRTLVRVVNSIHFNTDQMIEKIDKFQAIVISKHLLTSERDWLVFWNTLYNYHSSKGNYRNVSTLSDDVVAALTR